jgi:hypothetical protein
VHFYSSFWSYACSNRSAATQFRATRRSFPQGTRIPRAPRSHPLLASRASRPDGIQRTAGRARTAWPRVLPRPAPVPRCAAVSLRSRASACVALKAPLLLSHALPPPPPTPPAPPTGVPAPGRGELERPQAELNRPTASLALIRATALPSRTTPLSSSPEQQPRRPHSLAAGAPLAGSPSTPSKPSNRSLATP